MRPQSEWESTKFPHRGEWVRGWQYAHVYRLALKTEDLIRLGPPDGKGWEVNTDHGEDGFTVTPVAWKEDGSIVLQMTHWRRRKRGSVPGAPGFHISVLIEWDGDPTKIS